MDSRIMVRKFSKLLVMLSALVMFWLFTGLSSCSKDEKAMLSSTWKVENMKVHPDSGLRFPPNAYILTFSGNNSYSLKLDINSCGGPVKFEKNQKVTFESPACTKACCDSDFALKLVSTLIKCNTYEDSDKRLQFKASDGSLVLFTKQ